MTSWAMWPLGCKALVRKLRILVSEKQDQKHSPSDSAIIRRSTATARNSECMGQVLQMSYGRYCTQWLSLPRRIHTACKRSATCSRLFLHSILEEGLHHTRSRMLLLWSGDCRFSREQQRAQRRPVESKNNSSGQQSSDASITCLEGD